MMRRALIVGGAGGIGLSAAKVLSAREECERVYVVDKARLGEEYRDGKMRDYVFDLASPDYSFFDRFRDVDALLFTAGFGKPALFRDLDERHVVDSFNVNAVSCIRLIRRFYGKLESREDFCCGVMGSIAGFMSSPFFSVYAATKAALKIFIESVNVELAKSGSANRILNVSPGAIKGTGFYGGRTDLSLTSGLAREIISRMERKEDLFIPQYDEVFREVLRRYHEDFRAEGTRSYEYKLKSLRGR